ncbi:MAG: GNAT family N-acetyltransferase [Kiloniellaceae bacterium]
MTDNDLAWRAEEACMNAWPSPRQAVFGGWLLRAAGGAIRRANSVNPLRGCNGDAQAVIPVAEALYGALGQTPLFRIPSLVGSPPLERMEGTLESAGYTAEGHTLTLFAELTRGAAAAGGDVELLPQASGAWLDARARMSGIDAAERQSYEAMLDSILLPRVFAAARDDGQIASVAYAVVLDGLAVIESVITDPALRQRGLARRSVGTLLDWARACGARGACLQVVADNPPALKLYRSLGFDRELYRYHYRRKDAAKAPR